METIQILYNTDLYIVELGLFLYLKKGLSSVCSFL